MYVYVPCLTAVRICCAKWGGGGLMPLGVSDSTNRYMYSNIQELTIPPLLFPISVSHIFFLPPPLPPSPSLLPPPPSLPSPPICPNTAGYKGYSLAMMVDLFCAVLSGGGPFAHHIQVAGTCLCSRSGEHLWCVWGQGCVCHAISQFW